MKTLGEIVEDAARRFEEAKLAFGHGTSNAFDEAAFIALESLKLSIDGLDEFWDRKLSAAEKQTVEKIVAARIATRKPASYLLNRAYIQGIPFYVDERVIVPRSFIAEILCQEDGFSRIENMNIKSVLDLCTGSGCLAVLAAHLFPGAKIDAVDISKDAIDVAKINVRDSGLENHISLFTGDLFAPINNKYDLIISNPPYVDEGGMKNLPQEYKHEPALALGSGADGLDVTRKILSESAKYLNPGGGLICEIGRGKDNLEAAYPRTPFLWLDTEGSEGEVFWLGKEDLPGK